MTKTVTTKTHHIILIDDDEELRLSTALVLEEAGYQVSSFNMLTTIEELSELGADLFIIDERLPGVSGHIICIMLHSAPATKRIPQLLISASPLLGKFAELGEVDARLQKPFDIDELLKTVAGCIAA
jgi:CheY-like chemotaxis protein